MRLPPHRGHLRRLEQIQWKGCATCSDQCLHIELDRRPANIRPPAVAALRHRAELQNSGLDAPAEPVRLDAVSEDTELRIIPRDTDPAEKSKPLKKLENISSFGNVVVSAPSASKPERSGDLPGRVATGPGSGRGPNSVRSGPPHRERIA
jgi:hypothetical protein